MVKTAIVHTSDIDGPVVIKLFASVKLVTVNVLTVPAFTVVGTEKCTEFTTGLAINPITLHH
jgi:hypothetical protein